jgi:hypothetical protein
VTFLACDKEMVAGYLARHQLEIHGSSGMDVEPPIAASIVRRQYIYNISFPSRNDFIVCPVEGLTGRATTVKLPQPQPRARTYTQTCQSTLRATQVRAALSHAYAVTYQNKITDIP